MSGGELRLSVKNMKCAGCVARAREALSKLPGCESAEFDLASGSAVVRGAVDSQAVVQALSRLGYPAEARNP